MRNIALILLGLSTVWFFSCAQAGSIAPTTPQDKIIEGTDIDVETVPFFVRIMIRYDNEPADTRNHLCGGSLLNSNFVLTAGHCMRDDDEGREFELFARIGPRPFGVFDEEIKVARRILHPNFKLVGTQALGNETLAFYQFDIGLLELETPAESTSFVRLSDEVVDSTEGQNFTIIGFGRLGPGTITLPELGNFPVTIGIDALPQSLQQQQMVSLPNDSCPAVINAAGFNDTICAKAKDPIVLLGVIPLPNPGVFLGDSGSALLKEVDGVFYQQGLVSSGALDASAYTRISTYLPWIQDNMGLEPMIEVLGTLTIAHSYNIPQLGQTLGIHCSTTKFCQVGTSPTDPTELPLPGGFVFLTLVPALSLETITRTFYLPRHAYEVVLELKNVFPMALDFHHVDTDPWFLTQSRMRFNFTLSATENQPIHWETQWQTLS